NRVVVELLGDPRSLLGLCIDDVLQERLAALFDVAESPLLLALLGHVAVVEDDAANSGIVEEAGGNPFDHAPRAVPMAQAELSRPLCAGLLVQLCEHLAAPCSILRWHQIQRDRALEPLGRS